MYLVRIESEAELRAFEEALRTSPNLKAQKLARNIRFYLTDYPAGQCADCGIPLEGSGLVSKESAELNEVFLEGFRAIEAKPRIVCKPCWEKAAERLVAEQAAQGL